MKDNEDPETCSVVSDSPGPSPVRCWHVVTLSHVACSHHHAASISTVLKSKRTDEESWFSIAVPSVLFDFWYSSFESLARSFASPSYIAVAVEDVGVFLWLLLWF